MELGGDILCAQKLEQPTIPQGVGLLIYISTLTTNLYTLTIGPAKKQPSLAGEPGTPSVSARETQKTPKALTLRRYLDPQKTTNQTPNHLSFGIYDWMSRA